MINVVEGLEKQVTSYQDDVIQLVSGLGRDAPDFEKVSVVVDDLVVELDENSKNLTEKRSIKKQVEKAESQLKSIEEKIRSCRDEIGRLFQEGKAENEEQFRRRERLFSERNALIQKLNQSEKNMRHISGESDILKLRASLEQLTIEEIHSKEKELSIKADDLERDLEDLRTKRAELKQTIEALKSADDISELRTEEERIRAETKEHAFDWSKYTLAKLLIDKARERFEKEQQPKVIRDAGSLFEKITESSYTDLFAPIGENSIEAINYRKERKKPEELSRGTAEQLYLSIRFGYIRNRAEAAEPLPVIMDDILVNFDPSRAEQAARVISELSKNHQVLFFTCHPETLDVFRSTHETIQVFSMEGGHFTEH